MALTRGCSPELLAILAKHFHPVLLTEAGWSDGVANIHTGVGDLSWDGKTWLGAGNLVQLEAPDESGGIVTSEGSVRVAVDIATIMAERAKVIRNRSIRVWWGATTTAGGNVLAAEPVQFFTGYFDSRRGTVSRQGQDLSHDMILGLGIGPGARSKASIVHNYEDQIAKYAGDTAGRQVQIASRLKANPKTWPQT